MIKKKANSIKKSKLKTLSIIIVVVLFIPMLYSSIYLGSIWDVYDKLNTVSVAFVNLDKSVTKDGKEYSIGKDVEKNLKDNDKVNWKIVSHDEAINGLKGTKYYALIEIPADFSINIATVQDGKFQTPEIIYMANKGENYVFSQISSKVADSIKTEVSSSIQKEVSKTLVSSLEDVKVAFKDAGVGASQLHDGTDKLSDGSQKLSDGIQSAAEGSSKLETGLQTATSSTDKLQAGSEKLLNGSSALSDGITTVADGSQKLATGLQTISAGQIQIVNGSSALIDGLKTMKNSLSSGNSQIDPLINGATTVNSKTGAIAQVASQIDDSVNNLSSAIGQVDSVLHSELEAIDNSNLSASDKATLKATISVLDGMNTTTDNSPAPLAKVSQSVHQLSSGLGQLKNGTQQVSDGVSTMAAALSITQSKAAAGVDQLIAGASRIQTGSNSILSGLNTATEKTEQLSTGLSTLSTGSKTLNDGLKALNDGNISLEKGLTTAAEKTGALTEGLKTLSIGSKTLTDGLLTANEGASKLSNGLNDGYDKMNSKLKFNSENMSQFISKPVALKDSYINDVKYYGEGLAPYFMSVSLWIGAMILNIVLTLIKSKSKSQSKLLTGFIGRYLFGCTIVAIQGVILSVAVTKILGATPPSLIKFYLMNSFISVVFYSFIYGIAFASGAFSSAFVFGLLLIQLSSCAGTFPIETAPLFYRIVNRIIPMTYSVSSLRMTISGINQTELTLNIIIMLIFIALAMVGGYLIRSLINKHKESSEIANNNEFA